MLLAVKLSQKKVLFLIFTENGLQVMAKFFKSVKIILKIMELGGAVTKGTLSRLFQMKMTMLRELFFSNTLFQRILIILTATLRLMLENGML